MRNSSSSINSPPHGAHASVMLSALDDVAVNVVGSDVSGESRGVWSSHWRSRMLLIVR